MNRMTFDLGRLAIGPAVVSAIIAAQALAGCSSVVAHVAAVPEAAAGSAVRQASLESVSRLTPLIYVSGFYCRCVKIYKQAGRHQPPIATIRTGPGNPSGLFVTPDNALWVTMGDGHSVEVYQRGQPLPSKVLADPGQYAFDVVVDTDGTVYVGNASDTRCCQGSVSVYKNGSLTPTSKLNVPGSIAVAGLTLDDHHNLFGTGEPRTLGSGFVDEFEAGTITPKRLPFATPYAHGLQVDNTSDVLVADTFSNAVKAFAQGQRYPKFQFHIVNNQPLYVALTRKETRVYILAGDVLEYTYPEGRLVDLITTGLPFYPSGIAVSPPAPL